MLQKDYNVKLIQEKLISKGYSVGACGADGYFGKGTHHAVINFQAKNGLMVDGIVGPYTWDKIMN
ncbi:peptidoglycan-binding protein [Haloimpatiens sp. FM7330]|uniref:peptidoglycan-binding domain-containing protein n=1 Tax=Haloimpatiens sp. FM7330 TaxID=3298610 RepID=UPI0036262144